MNKHRLPIDPIQWVAQIGTARGDNHLDLLRQALDFYTQNKLSGVEKGVGVADILWSLGLDNEALAAALIYPALQAKQISLESISAQWGESNARLLSDVMQMQSLGKLQHIAERGQHQVENLRKMLLAMLTDVRAVLIVLTERLWQLRHAKEIDKTEQQHIAAETLSVYAPLANRLGIWQLKWEIEDLCLRYLHPDIYSKLVKGIASRRDDRQHYINQFSQILTQELTKSGLKDFQVTGRVKHIYSIYKKMLRKNADLEQIYDMSALRVLVQTIEACYAVLGTIQNHWQHIPEEFDDYISHPKPNGYRSIHTVIIGPNNHIVEVQIRTERMHQESELGVAAHWRYKEGVLQPSNEEARIALLRQIIEWQKEVVNTNEIKQKQTANDLFADRIYVFTPLGDIIELPAGATPLDFAYTVHSEVGHRCRGAKVDGNIVPLTYELQMGQRVEILTAKQANPSRDWINPQLGFLKSARARAKVQHWFRIEDSREQHAESNKGAFTKEIRRKAGAIVQNKMVPKLILPKPAKGHSSSAVNVFGTNNLLTHIARCCKPLPGDPILGYVTRQRNMSIHHRDCKSIENFSKNNKDRLLAVSWGGKESEAYAVDLVLRVFDRPGLLRDITAFVANEKMNVVGLQTKKNEFSAEIDIYLTIEIASRKQLTTVLKHLKSLPNVIDARRR